MGSSPPYPAVWERPPRGRVLVLAPHPDDEILGCGGVMALHQQQGDEVAAIIATDGAAGDPDGYYPKDVYRGLREEESRAAARILGVPKPQFWGLPDGALGNADGVVEKVLDALTMIRPDIVYHPSVDEVHPDHYALAAAFREALKACSMSFSHYAYEIWATVRPTHIIDIGAVWDRKKKAMEQYETQIRYNDHVHKISGLNAYRAIYLPSARYVEAFEAG
jgi:LmbE family N-acetylglucosaminyl deacetylase